MAFGYSPRNEELVSSLKDQKEEYDTIYFELKNIAWKLYDLTCDFKQLQVGTEVIEWNDLFTSKKDSNTNYAHKLPQYHVDDKMPNYDTYDFLNDKHSRTDYNENSEINLSNFFEGMKRKKFDNDGSLNEQELHKPLQRYYEIKLSPPYSNSKGSARNYAQVENCRDSKQSPRCSHGDTNIFDKKSPRLHNNDRPVEKSPLFFQENRNILNEKSPRLSHEERSTLNEISLRLPQENKSEFYKNKNVLRSSYEGVFAKQSPRYSHHGDRSQYSNHGDRSQYSIHGDRSQIKHTPRERKILNDADQNIKVNNSLYEELNFSIPNIEGEENIKLPIPKRSPTYNYHTTDHLRSRHGNIYVNTNDQQRRPYSKMSNLELEDELSKRQYGKMLSTGRNSATLNNSGVRLHEVPSNYQVFQPKNLPENRKVYENLRKELDCDAKFRKFFPRIGVLEEEENVYVIDTHNYKILAFPRKVAGITTAEP